MKQHCTVRRGALGTPLDELDHWAPILLKALQGIALLRDAATDQQIARRCRLRSIGMPHHAWVW
jgi:hypothetical protein